MNKILCTGLCALLMGMPSISPNETNKSINKVSQTVQQNIFVSVDGNYSLKTNPAEYGFTLQRHVSDVNTLFDDTYFSSIGFVRIGAAETPGDIKEIYEAYTTNHLASMNNFLMQNAKPGQGVRIVGKGDNSTIIDNNQAIRGGAELWMFSGDMLKPTYSEKFNLEMTLSHDKKNIYTFTLFCYKDGKNAEDEANKFYNDILKNFHALK